MNTRNPYFWLLEGEPDPDSSGAGSTDDGLIEIETVDGSQKVSLDDLKKGFMRQADYTKKTQELAEQIRAKARALADEETADITAEYEARIAELESKVPPPEEPEYEDPSVKAIKSEVKELKAELKAIKSAEKQKEERIEYANWLDVGLKKLHEKYPLMQDDVVVAVLAMGGEVSKSERDEKLEQAARMSHDKTDAMIKSKLEEVSKPKPKSTNLPPGGGPPSPGKTPKTFDEALKATLSRVEQAAEGG